MLSPATGAGLMSPVLAHTSELAAAAAAREAPATPPRNGSAPALEAPCMQEQAAAGSAPRSEEPDQAAGAGAGAGASFLSLSPTMQWLQVRTVAH
jgi:hypothetical protein